MQYLSQADLFNLVLCILHHIRHKSASKQDSGLVEAVMLVAVFWSTL